MKNDIIEYMKERFNKIAETDAVKKKIVEVKKELFLKTVMEEECCDTEEVGDRG